MAEADPWVYATVGIVVGILATYLIALRFTKKSRKESKEDLKEHRRELMKLEEEKEHAKKIAGDKGKIKFRPDKKIVVNDGKAERKDTWVAEKTITFTADAVLKKSYDIEIPAFASQHIDSPYVEPRVYTTSIDHPIIWQNNDDTAHTITSGSRRKISTDNDVEDGRPDGLFDKKLNPHENFEFAFKKEGIYHYYCKLHKCSEATIVIK